MQQLFHPEDDIDLDQVVEMARKPVELAGDVSCSAGVTSI
jgi:hypothetical protein